MGVLREASARRKACTIEFMLNDTQCSVGRDLLRAGRSGVRILV